MATVGLGTERSGGTTVALLATGLLAASYLVLAVTGPHAVGLWVDDSIYLCTAKSLAAGTGYRHIEIPGEPLQAKYPVLYPAILALGFLWGPDYPRNMPLLLAPTALAAGGFVVLCALYWRRFFRASWREAVLVGGLAALSPAIVSMVRFTMSDLVYALLAVAGLYAIDRGCEERKQRGGWAWPIAAGLLIAAAVLTRSIGMTLAAGSLAFLLWRRRTREAVLLAAVLGACLLPWYAWQRWALQVNAITHPSLLLISELSYQPWAPSDPGATLRVAFQNVFRTAFGLLYFEWALPLSWARRTLAAPSWATWGVHALAYTALLLTVVGFVASGRTQLRALHVCAILYAGVVLVYPGDPYRFFLPWTPFLMYFLLRGLREVVERPRSDSRAPRRAARATGALGLLLAGLFVYEVVRIARSSDESYHMRVASMDWTELRSVEERIRAGTAEHHTIASTWFARLYLSTSRQGYFSWPITDPYATFYGPGREWWNFYLNPDAATVMRLEGETRAGLADAYRAADVDWVLDHAQPNLLGDAVRSLLLSHLEWFPPRYQTPGGTFRLHRVRLPPR